MIMFPRFKELVSSQQPEFLYLVAKDRRFPFSIRAGLVNAFRRQIRIGSGLSVRGPSVQPRVRKHVEPLRSRYSKRRVTKRGVRHNFRTVNAERIVRVYKSKGKNRVGKCVKEYKKQETQVIHLVGTKDLWRYQ